MNPKRPPENVVQSWKQNIKPLTHMKNLKCLDLHIQSLIDVVWTLDNQYGLGMGFDMVKQTLPSLDQLLKSLPVGAEGSRFCKVRLLFLDNPKYDEYVSLFREAWKDFDVEFVELYS